MSENAIPLSDEEIDGGVDVGGEGEDVLLREDVGDEFPFAGVLGSVSEKKTRGNGLVGGRRRSSKRGERTTSSSPGVEDASNAGDGDERIVEGRLQEPSSVT